MNAEGQVAANGGNGPLRSQNHSDIQQYQTWLVSHVMFQKNLVIGDDRQDK